MRTYDLRCVVGIVLVLSAGSQASAHALPQDDIDAQTCDPSHSYKIGDSIKLLDFHVGETTAYFESGLLVPDPIPIGVTAGDTDKLLLECPDDCEEQTVTHPTTITWTLLPVTPNEDRLGSFISSQGEYVDTIVDAERVLYLPPRNLDRAEEVEVEILATVTNACLNGGAADAPLEVRFRVAVLRQPEPYSYYDVSGALHDWDEAEDDDEGCGDVGEGCCQYIPGGPDQADPISVELDEEKYPLHGMLTHERRVITVDAEDRDSAFWECGVPPCLSTYPQGEDVPRQCGALIYSWSFDEGSDKGELLFADQNRRTVIFESNGTPGRIVLRVQVIDTGGGFNEIDPPEQITITFHVYDLSFIDQRNWKIDRIKFFYEDAPTYNTTEEGVQVSEDDIDALQDPGISGCVDGDAGFMGDHIGSNDPRTYRLELDETEAPNSNRYKVRLRVFRADGDDTDQVFEHEYLFSGDNQDPLWRLAEDIRFVSNANPGGAAGVYDDDVCGDQTVRVELGDWAQAALLVKDSAQAGSDYETVSHIELPVERVWSEVLPETLARRHKPHTIKEGQLKFYVSEASAHWGPASTFAPAAGDWNQTTEKLAERATEDFAQLAIRFNRRETKMCPPFHSNIFLIETGSPITPDPPGMDGAMRVEWAAPGFTGQADVPVFVGESLTLEDFASRVESVLAPHFGGTAVDEMFFGPDNLVNREGQLVMLMHAQHTDVAITIPGASNTTTALGAQHLAEYGVGPILSMQGKSLQAAAWKDGFDWTFDVFIAPLDPETIATGETFYDGQPGIPQVLQPSIWLGQRPSNGDDDEKPTTLGHELGHLLGPILGHAPADEGIMFAPTPEPEALEGKRFYRWSEMRKSRENSQLSDPFIRIPARKTD